MSISGKNLIQQIRSRRENVEENCPSSVHAVAIMQNKVQTNEANAGKIKQIPHSVI